MFKFKSYDKVIKEYDKLIKNTQEAKEMLIKIQKGDYEPNVLMDFPSVDDNKVNTPLNEDWKEFKEYILSKTPLPAEDDIKSWLDFHHNERECMYATRQKLFGCYGHTGTLGLVGINSNGCYIQETMQHSLMIWINPDDNLTDVEKSILKIVEYMKPGKNNEKSFQIMEQSLSRYGSWVLNQRENKTFYLGKCSYKLMAEMDNVPLIKILKEIKKMNTPRKDEDD
jgi:hypothetical protein